MLALWMRIRSQADLILILCVGALVRGVFFAAAAGSPERFWSQDDLDYLGIATHLHASYVADAGVWFDAGLRRPPVYPLFVRLVFEVFGQHYAAVVAVQLVLGVATIGLVFWLAGLMLSRRLALVAAALLAIDPASVIFTNLMLTETVFAFLLTAAIGLVIVARRRGDALLMAAAGVILGLSALTRPVAVYLPLVLAPVLVLTATGGMANAHRSGETGIQRHRRSRSAGLVAAAVLVLGFALPVGTWVARNASQTGVAVLSTIDGHNMLNYRAVGALVESGELPWDARRKVNEQLAARVAPNANAAEVSRTQMWLGLEILAHHPRRGGAELGER